MFLDGQNRRTVVRGHFGTKRSGDVVFFLFDVLFKTGQVDRESRSLAEFAVNFDKTFGLADNSVNHGQSQTGAGTDNVLFGGEKRFENAVKIFFGNTATGIRNLDNHKFARFDRVFAERLRPRNVFGTRRYCQNAVTVHGIFGIDGQIDNDLRKLDRIHLDKTEIAAVMEFEDDFFAENPFEHLAEFHKVLGNVNQFRLQRLFARKRQQLSHQTGGAVGIVFDLDKVGKRRIADAVTLQQQIAEADNGR